eukprot:Sdes_comp9726_c0_seq1m1228
MSFVALSCGRIRPCKVGRNLWFSANLCSSRSPVRVRFAPSPTGQLHLGSLRTALYNFLYARSEKGTCILRIEDTDRSRFVEGSEQKMIDTLSWCGISFDEGPHVGGPYGPYRQSERTRLYQKYADELLAKGKAYRCFCSEATLCTMRSEQRSRGAATKYDKRCSRMTREEIDRKLTSGAPFTIRMNISSTGITETQDYVYGKIVFENRFIDDQILMKADGFPTYHFANVIDDHTMRISHVIRGEEWINSTPKHLLLYQYLGFPNPPVYAHLPLLISPDGSKLSKRNQDSFVNHYIQQGYLSQSLINFVAFMGWYPSAPSSGENTEEVLSMNQLVERFSLDRINRAAARVSSTKLDWFNKKHMDLIFGEVGLDAIPMNPPISNLVSLLSKAAHQQGYSELPPTTLAMILKASYFRFSRIPAIVTEFSFFWQQPVYEGSKLTLLRSRFGWNKDLLTDIFQLLDNVPEKDSFFSKDHFQKVNHDLNVLSKRYPSGSAFHALRYGISGLTSGPNLGDIVVILGGRESRRRMEAFEGFSGIDSIL